MRYLAFLAALLLAGAAHAWTNGPDGGGTCSGLARSGQQCYYDFSDTTDSGILSTAPCRDVNIQFDPDEDGTNTGATIDLYRCTEATASANTCAKICAVRGAVWSCDALDGDATAQKSGIQNVQAAFIYVVVTANAGSDDARVQVTCH